MFYLLVLSAGCVLLLLVPSAVRWCCFGCFLGYPSEVGVITEISLRNLSTSFLFCCFGPFPFTTLPKRGADVPIKNSEDALARGAGTTATATTIWKWDAGCGCPPRHCESHEANTDHCPPRACGSPHQTTCSSSCRPIERCRRLLLHPVCEGGQGGGRGATTFTLPTAHGNDDVVVLTREADHIGRCVCRGRGHHSQRAVVA
jgi:hypothetical protein